MILKNQVKNFADPQPRNLEPKEIEPKDDLSNSEDEVKSEASKSDTECQERTFLTFSDHDTFREAFPTTKRRLTQQKICPITRLPAKYYDPVTQHPYANLQAFRILRETYYNQLEQKGDKNDPEVRVLCQKYFCYIYKMSLILKSLMCT